jgi:hypothetical protein
MLSYAAKWWCYTTKNDQPYDGCSGTLFNGSDLQMAGRALSEEAKDPAVKLMEIGSDQDILLDTTPTLNIIDLLHCRITSFSTLTRHYQNRHVSHGRLDQRA